MSLRRAPQIGSKVCKVHKRRARACYRPALSFRCRGRCMSVVVRLLLCLLVFCATDALAKSAAAPAAAPADALIWRGDHTTGRAIMEDLAKEYAKARLGKISLQPFSTVSGLDAVNNGSADIAGSARGKYARRVEEANLEFAPIALDAARARPYAINLCDFTIHQLHKQAHLQQIAHRSGERTGLGLYIARRLMELGGGTIEASSGGLGQGATFTLRFPAVTATKP